MEKEVRQRLQWVKLDEESGDAGLVCRRCAISRPTQPKWWKRYQAQSIDDLKNQGRQPHNSPAAPIGSEHEELILKLRGKRRLGSRRIQSELKRLHDILFPSRPFTRFFVVIRQSLWHHIAVKASSRVISARFPVNGCKWIPAPATSLLVDGADATI